MGGKSKRRYMLGLIYLKKLLQTVMVTVTEKVMMLCRESHICSPKFAEARFNRSYFNKLNRTQAPMEQCGSKSHFLSVVLVLEAIVTKSVFDALLIGSGLVAAVFMRIKRGHYCLSV